MHETFGCVHPSDSGRTPMMAEQGMNGQPTWRSQRTLVTEHGIAYGGRPLGQRRLRSTPRMGKPCTWGRESGTSVDRRGGMHNARNCNLTVDYPKPPPHVHYTELERRIRAGECEACGSREHPEVHHVHKLKDIRGRGGRGVPAWRRHMIAIQRKTLILCSAIPGNLLTCCK